jgi:hypothetical protein
MNNTNNVIDFSSRQNINTINSSESESESESDQEHLLDITYSNVDEAFEHFLYHMSEELGYHEIMAENEDLEISMGYVLSFARSAYARACNLEDSMTPYVTEIVNSVKDETKNDSC